MSASPRIRKAIAGEVQDAEGIAAVRAALSRLFDGFVLHRSAAALCEGDRLEIEMSLTEAESKALRSGDAEIVLEMTNPPGVVEAAEYVIELQVKPSALAGYDDNLEPVLRREPLYQAEDNYRLGSSSRGGKSSGSSRSRKSSGGGSGGNTAQKKAAGRKGGRAAAQSTRRQTDARASVSPPSGRPGCGRCSVHAHRRNRSARGRRAHAVRGPGPRLTVR